MTKFAALVSFLATPLVAAVPPSVAMAWRPPARRLSVQVRRPSGQASPAPGLCS